MWGGDNLEIIVADMAGNLVLVDIDGEILWEKQVRVYEYLELSFSLSLTHTHPHTRKLTCELRPSLSFAAEWYLAIHSYCR